MTFAQIYSASKKAVDTEKELEYQIALVKAKLESFGIVTENLDMK
nr:hypothetical protein [uncultured Acetatifactor sp.]